MRNKIATEVLKMSGRRPGYAAGGRQIHEDPVPNGDGPVKPDCLTTMADDIWDEVIEAWEGTGMLTMADSHQLSVYCELMARFREYRNRGKFLPVNEMGNLRAYSAMFGLDPASRSRFNAQPKEKPNEDDIGKLRNRSA